MSLTILHPATVHFPIGLLILASLSGLYYLTIQARKELLVLTWWPMLAGWGTCLVSVFTGIFDQGKLPPDPPYARLLDTHVSTGLAVLLVYGILLFQRWSNRNKATVGDPVLDSARGLTRLWIGFLLVVGAGLVIWAGWSGGQLVYKWGVNVR